MKLIRLLFYGLCAPLLIACSTINFNEDLVDIRYETVNFEDISQPMCHSLELQGYEFYQFDVRQTNTIFMFQSGHEISFSEDAYIHAILLTGINRQFDTFEGIDEQESMRLGEIAQEVCEDISKEMQILGLSKVGVGFQLWDWIVGARVGYYGGSCNNLNGHISFGSYGDAYEFEDFQSICP